MRTLRELARSYLTTTKDLTRVMSRLKAVYRSWAIPCAGRDVYYTRHRAEWLEKIKHAGVRRFPFGVEIGGGRTMLTETVVRAIGVGLVAIPGMLTLKGRGCSLDFPLLRLRSIAVGMAELREFDAMVWASPKVTSEPERDRPREIASPIESVPTSRQEETADLGPEWRGILQMYLA